MPLHPLGQPSPEALTAQEQGRAIDLCASQLSSRFDAKLGEQHVECSGMDGYLLANALRRWSRF